MILFYAALGLAGSLNLYVKTYLWQLSARQTLIVGLATAIGLLLGVLSARLTAVRFDKRTILVAGMLLYTAIACSPVLLWLAGLAPHVGSQALMALLVATGVAAGIAIAQVGVVTGSMMADVADENELLTGRRQEGIFFGGLAFAGQAAVGVGGLVAGAGLSAMAFPTNAAVGTIAHGALVGLALLDGPGAALLCVASAFVGLRYTLTRARHDEVMAMLRAAA